MKIIPIFLLAAATATAAPQERATYNGAGRLTSLIQSGSKLGVQAQFEVNFEGGVEVPLQPDNQRSPISRNGTERHWRGTINFSNGGSASLDTSWADDGEEGIALDGTLIAGSMLDVQSAEYIIDVPRAEFKGGRLEPVGLDLPDIKPEEVTFFRGEVDALTFTVPSHARSFSLKLARPLPVTVTDRWDASGRSYRVRIALRTGAWAQGEALKLGLVMQAAGETPAAAARLSVDPGAPRFAFDGYGANYCWGTQPALTSYMLNHLQHAWTRHELKAVAWDKERGNPGSSLTQDFELMQRMQRAGLPWIISVWHLPQRFYGDANQRPAGSFGRRIAPDRWNELLELFGSYLVYMKAHYGAEPDLFSFNEPDLGVDIGFTPETHREAIKRIGAHLASLGLKTKMLLGDTANPRDTHRFVLAAAADTEAMHYVGAVSFHSWGNGSPTQYAAWGDVAEWLHLPLLIAEAGVNPDAYHNNAYDSYDYGLAEAAQQQELLRYARPTASLYWQFTTDYGLARVQRDGSVEPTGRFWLMKHFTDLTPRKSQALTSASDQPDVLISAFGRGEDLTVHVLNLGPARNASISGLPAEAWRKVTTTENTYFTEGQWEASASPTLALPARSLTTLTRRLPK